MVFCMPIVIFLLTLFAFVNSYHSVPVVAVNSDIVIRNVDRSIDISTQLAKILCKITVENNGKNDVKNLLFAVQPQIKSKVVYIAAQVCIIEPRPNLLGCSM